MLLSLLDQLDAILAEEPKVMDEDAEELESAANALIVGYAVSGVDTGLDPESASEADLTAQVTALAAAEPESGLNGSLLNGLLATIDAIRGDLAGVMTRSGGMQ